jgi:hypothetical protein
MALVTAAQQELLARSAALVRAALADQRLFPSLRPRLVAAARETSARVLERVPGIVAQTAGAAAAAGSAHGGAVAERAGYRVPTAWAGVIPHGPNSASMVARDLTEELTAAAYRITRFADDAYRAAVAEAAARQVTAALAPHGAQEHAWRALTAQGVTGYTDRAGRNWNLATYTEMAVRTAAARAYRASQMDRMTQMGLLFWVVDGTGRPCPLCAPWEGKVLSSMAPGTYQSGGRTVTVEATVEEATAAGLFHPNCRHTLAAYTPGATLLRPTPWTAHQEALYRASQRLRELERRVRAAKAQHDAALTPADRAAAAVRVRAGQAAIRHHVAATGVLRRRSREQLDLGFTQP